MAEEKKNAASAGSPLEGFEALAKSSSGSSCVMVIQQVLKHPHIFVFGELLDLQSVKDLANNAQHKPYLELLRLFAYGTFGDYKAKQEKEKLPQLSAKELTKLKQLTIVDNAAKNKLMSYVQLMKELELANVRELEDLIIECVYQGLIQGKLDQRKGAFEVQSVIGRDLGPQEVESMIGTLNQWLQSSESLIKTLEKKIEQANTQFEKKKKDAADLSKERADRIEAIKIELAQGSQEALAMAMGMPGMRGGPDDERRKGGRRGAGDREPRDPRAGSGGASGLVRKMFGAGAGPAAGAGVGPGNPGARPRGGQ